MKIRRKPRDEDTTRSTDDTDDWKVTVENSADNMVRFVIEPVWEQDIPELLREPGRAPRRRTRDD